MMKRETPVDKIARFHNEMEQKKSYRIARRAHTFLVAACLLTVVLTGGLYAYENLMLIDDPDSVEMIISTKAEYSDGEPIEFYVIDDTAYHNTTTEVNTVLRCDAHNGEGMLYVGSSVNSLEGLHHSSSTVHPEFDDAVTNTKVFMDTIGDKTSLKVRANGIRRIVADSVPTITYNGDLPEGPVDTCVAEHTISTTSPIFGIPRKETILGYPFEYVQYEYFRGRDE